MTIKIQTKKPSIPIEIGDLKFEFQASDESILTFREEGLKAQKEFHSITLEEEDEKAVEQAKSILKRAFDLILGDGAFEKIYELSPSVIICMHYFTQITQGIEEELRKRGFAESVQEKAKKYLKKK